MVGRRVWVVDGWFGFGVWVLVLWVCLMAAGTLRGRDRPLRDQQPAWRGGGESEARRESVPVERSESRGA
jgi:hypothetical protein